MASDLIGKVYLAISDLAGSKVVGTAAADITHIQVIATNEGRCTPVNLQYLCSS
jgi:hypothetical protein